MKFLPPFPVRLAYHWTEKISGKIVVFDGQRSGFFPGVGPNTTMSYPMFIAPPNEPREYILFTTIVRDGVRWFEDLKSSILHEFDVTVVGDDYGDPDLFTLFSRPHYGSMLVTFI